MLVYSCIKAFLAEFPFLVCSNSRTRTKGDRTQCTLTSWQGESKREIRPLSGCRSREREDDEKSSNFVAGVVSTLPLDNGQHACDPLCVERQLG